MKMGNDLTALKGRGDLKDTHSNKNAAPNVDLFKISFVHTYQCIPQRIKQMHCKTFYICKCLCMDQIYMNWIFILMKWNYMNVNSLKPFSTKKGRIKKA